MKNKRKQPETEPQSAQKQMKLIKLHAIAFNCELRFIVCVFVWKHMSASARKWSRPFLSVHNTIKYTRKHSRHAHTHTGRQTDNGRARLSNEIEC